MGEAPAFGQADLTNCERELIHLAGSVQPHGVLLVLDGADRSIVQASDNAGAVLGVAAQALLGRPLAALDDALDCTVRQLAAAGDLAEPEPLHASVDAGGTRRALHGLLHRLPAAALQPALLLLELEPLAAAPGQPEPVTLAPQALQATVAECVRRFGEAPGLAVLADAAARGVRELTGYDRVMVYRFDPDGHGSVIAEARDPRLDPLLGHHYPATDIPQRARALYVRQRLRMLVDVHYVPAPLVPRLTPPHQSELDMSMCGLRSMSPLHLQYLKNMGVTATLVVSLVVGGQLWGLIAAHHHTPRNLAPALRAASALLAELMTTRLAALENYAHAQVALMVRRLEQRLVEATSIEGDWRLALLRHPPTLLQPLEASGAVLFHDGEVLTCGDVPATPELRALRDWVEASASASADGAPFACASVGHLNPALAPLTPLASGVLAVRLADDRPDWLMWLRKEQLHSITWAGDPHKPMVGDSPLELSPRRSFAAWSELVRGTARPWTPTELALARAIGRALVDIIVQVHSVRLLVGEQQLQRTRATIAGARQPVLVCRPDGRPLLANTAFANLTGGGADALPDWAAVAARLGGTEVLERLPQTLMAEGPRWRGGARVQARDGSAVPLDLRAELVPGRDGRPLGLVLVLADRREAERAEAARAGLEQAIMAASAARADLQREDGDDPLMRAILAHARLAAMDIAEASEDTPMAPVLGEVTASTQRAARLLGWLRAASD